MAKTVFILGAGFNLSVLDALHARVSVPPLSTTFFQVLIRHGRLRQNLDSDRREIYVDLLFEAIELYWHLDLDDLETEPLDVEECLTLFESIIRDPTTSQERQLDLRRARFALLRLLLVYLTDVSSGTKAPAHWLFGKHVWRTGADVITFNYDTIAEEAIGFGSGHGEKSGVSHENTRHASWDTEASVADEDLDASFWHWCPPRALGFQFDQLHMPVPGPSLLVDGPRYYLIPENKLYESRRLLKLHGSIDWLRYAQPRDYFPEDPGPPPTQGVVRLSRGPLDVAPATLGPWYMEPVIIPPELYKSFDPEPFHTLWHTALETLRECETLIVIGYSFPPTDFRTRRLFLEAFSDHELASLVVVDPNPAVIGIVRGLTRYRGPVAACDDLAAYYNAPPSWRDKRGGMSDITKVDWS